MSARVVKVGGSVLGDGAWLEEFARAVVQSSQPVVVVHGGGPDINAMSERLGLEYTWAGGRRVTSPELMDVVAMVLTGRVNKRIVSALVDAGADALGISGEDGRLITASFAEGGALGRVGRVQGVRAEWLEWLATRGAVPVVSPVSRGPDGRAVNVNADEVAGAVAVALGAPELVFVTDVPGVLEAGEVRAELSAGQARGLIEGGVAGGGMAVKLGAALAALETGVPIVRIGRADALLDDTSGTRIRPGAEVLAWV